MACSPPPPPAGPSSGVRRRARWRRRARHDEQTHDGREHGQADEPDAIKGERTPEGEGLAPSEEVEGATKEAEAAHRPKMAGGAQDGAADGRVVASGTRAAGNARPREGDELLDADHHKEASKEEVVAKKKTGKLEKEIKFT